jgi:type IV secretory pathway protease TraF
MGEFALLQTELKPVLKILSKTNWTIVAIHNHAILENPKTIFVHWDAKGPVQSIVPLIKEVLAIQQQSANNSSENPLAEIGEKIGDVFTGGGNEKK